MTQKNETPALIVALLITASLLGVGGWFVFQQINKSGGEQPIASPNPSQPLTSTNSQPQSQPSAAGFAQVQNVPAGLFNYGGSTTWAPIRGNVDSLIQSARPEFKLRYVNANPPDSGTGIQMLLDGQLAFAQSSRPLTDQEYQQAQQRGFRLTQTAIAIDGIAIAVNRSLTVSGLSFEKLKGIYTGQITNWQQIGGPNLAIVAFTRDPKSGTVELFRELVLDKQPLADSVKTVATTTEALQRLGSTPGGIYFASASEVVPQRTIKPLAIGRTEQEKLVPPYQEPLVTDANQSNRLNTQVFQSGTYPLTRNLFVVVKQNNGDEQKAGEAYANLLLSAAGQEAIGKAGFVRIR